MSDNTIRLSEMFKTRDNPPPPKDGCDYERCYTPECVERRNVLANVSDEKVIERARAIAKLDTVYNPVLADAMDNMAEISDRFASNYPTSTAGVNVGEYPSRDIVDDQSLIRAITGSLSRVFSGSASNYRHVVDAVTYAIALSHRMYGDDAERRAKLEASDARAAVENAAYAKYVAVREFLGSEFTISTWQGVVDQIDALINPPKATEEIV